MKFERFGFTDRRRQSSWNKDGHWRIYRFEVCYLEMRAQLTIWNNRFSTRDRRHTLTESIYAKILERLPFVVSRRIKKGKKQGKSSKTQRGSVAWRNFSRWRRKRIGNILTMTTGAHVKREARFDTKFFFLFFASFENSARAAVNKFKKMKRIL